MKSIHQKLLSLSIAATLFSGVAFADQRSLSLAPASERDQIPAELVSQTRSAMPGVELSREAVNFAWALDHGKAIESVSAPFVRQSREYWTDVEASTLRSGLPIAVSSAEAVIRISPRQDHAAPRALSASDVVIRHNGNALSRRAAIRAIADSKELAAAGASFPDGTLAFRMDPSLGDQPFELLMPQAEGAYVVHVYEPNSNVILQLSTDRDTAVHGQTFKVFAHIDAQGNRVSADSLSGVISAPDGSLVDLRFQSDGSGGYVADVRHDALSANGAGLWEVHAFGQTQIGGSMIRRDAKTAFASSLPTARLDGTARLASDRNTDSLDIEFGVDVAAEGRYEVRGVLYGSGARGQMMPFAIGHSAAWLRPGANTLTLTYDASLISGPDALGPPYELRDLRLLNQGNLELLERREHGLSIVTR